MTYSTILGDTWDVIALKTLGSEMYMSDIINANIEHADTVVFSAGTVLTIPEVTTVPDASLPPWKRGAI